MTYDFLSGSFLIPYERWEAHPLHWQALTGVWTLLSLIVPSLSQMLPCVCVLCVSWSLSYLWPLQCRDVRADRAEATSSGWPPQPRSGSWAQWTPAIRPYGTTRHHDHQIITKNMEEFSFTNPAMEPVDEGMYPQENIRHQRRSWIGRKVFTRLSF